MEHEKDRDSRVQAMMMTRPRRWPRLIRSALGAVVLAVMACGLFAVVRALTIRSRQPPARTISPVNIDVAAAAEHLGEAIRHQTITWPDPALIDPSAFLRLHAFLLDRYPATHRTLSREVVADYSLLYTWRGRDRAAPPVVLVAHLDVVPVDVATMARWTNPPFSGAVRAGAVWGRGAVDDKVGVVGIMEAVETLVSSGFVPERTVYVAFGHDEERGGPQGARQISVILKQRGVAADLLLDEGGIITRRAPGTTAPVAAVGIAEKGFVSLELTVETDGGHSSMPPAATAVGILSRAVYRVQESPMPARLEGPTRALLEFLAPEVSFLHRMLFANLWAVSPVIVRALTGDNIGNALVRTTTAPTMFSAGTKDNVLPPSARAVINVRILPGDSVSAVIDHVTDVVADSRVHVHPLRESALAEPSPVASLGRPFGQVQQAIRDVFPDVIAVPVLTVGATDARHYRDIAVNAYRFLPVGQPEVDRLIHGIDERLNLDQLGRAIQFYVTFLQETAGTGVVDRAR